MRSLNRNKIIFVLILLILVVGGLIIYSKISSNHRSLHVTTDTTGVDFEVGDQTFQLSSKETDISLRPQAYNYRAAYTSDGNRIVLTGKLDMTTQKVAKIVLNFSLYNKQVVFDTICNSFGPPCPFSVQDLKITYLENYSWAVVVINSPSLGRAFAVLQVENGSWKVMDGPATDINGSGFYPDSVVKELSDDQ